MTVSGEPTVSKRQYAKRICKFGRCDKCERPLRAHEVENYQFLCGTCAGAMGIGKPSLDTLRQATDTAMGRDYSTRLREGFRIIEGDY